MSTAILPASPFARIVVVPQFHYDVAYLCTAEDYFPRCITNLTVAADLLEADPSYRYAIEQPYLLEEILARAPALFARLQAAHARSQLEIIGALYLIPDLNLPSGESLLRQIAYGRAFLAQYFPGARTDLATLADTWGHPATLPQLLYHAGIRVYFFSRAMENPHPVSEFRWRSPDGSTVLAHWFSASYAALQFPAGTTENSLELSHLAATTTNLNTLLARIRPLTTGETALIPSGGDMACPTPTALPSIRRWQAEGLPISLGLTADYADALLAAAERLPLRTDEFNPLFIGSAASRIRLKLINRRLEAALHAAERLHALSPTPSADLAALHAAWKLTLVGQFHDIICGTLSDPAATEAYARYATAQRHLATFSAPWAPTPATPSAYFNPLAFPRTELLDPASPHSATLVTVPALGRATPAASIPWVELPGSSTLENEFWLLQLGPRGEITSCLDLANGTEHVDPARPHWNELVYRNDNGDLWLLDISPLDGGSPASQREDDSLDDPYRGKRDPIANDIAFGSSRHATLTAPLRLDHAAGIQRATTEADLAFWRNGCTYTQRTWLVPGDPLIHCETTIVPRGRRWRLYVTFPTPLTGPVWHETPGGCLERDARRQVAQTWIEARANSSPTSGGLRLLTAGPSAAALNDGVLSLLLFRSVAMDYKAASADAYEENVPHTFRYAFRPFATAEPGSVTREGARLNHPLVPVRPDLTLAEPPLLLGPASVHFDSLQRLPDGAWLLRLRETAGHPAAAHLHVPGILAAAITDAFGDGATPLPFTPDHRVCIPLRPWQITTLRLTRKL